MKVHLEPVNYDERIFDVLVDFTGYEDNECRYFKMWGIILPRRDREASEQSLDDLLAVLKLRRIRHWRSDFNQWRYGSKRIRVNIYRTTVISERGIE